MLSEGNSTRVRVTLLETFTLEDGIMAAGDKPARKLTLEIYDQLQIDKGMRTSVKVDCLDTPQDYHFITLLDAVRGDLRPHLK